MFFYTIEFMQNFVFAQLHCVPCLNFVMYGGKVERMRQYGMECVYTVHTVHTALRMCTCAVPVCYIGLEKPIGEAWYSMLQYITASVCNIGLEKPIEQKVEAPRWPIFKFQSQHPPACQENNIHCTAIQNTFLGFNDLGESTALSSVSTFSFEH